MACRSEFVSVQATAGVGVLPLDGASVGGIGIDLTAQFAGQVGDGGEDAARNYIPFDSGEVRSG